MLICHPNATFKHAPSTAEGGSHLPHLTALLLCFLFSGDLLTMCFFSSLLQTLLLHLGSLSWTFFDVFAKRSRGHVPGIAIAP
eukprot:Skav226251  [mRNA]  locus=scaffold2708:39920:40837:+ [translate_table: standard]